MTNITKSLDSTEKNNTVKWKVKKNIKEYLNKYIDEEINEILFIVPVEKQKNSPTTIPQ